MAQNPSTLSYKYLTQLTASIAIPSTTTLQSAYKHQQQRKMGRLMERMSSSVQSWVDEHKLTAIGAVWATAVGASVAYSRKRAPERTTSLRLIHARMHAQALTLAVLGGAALAHHYNKSSSSSSSKKELSRLDYEFYSQLPAATDADGQENER
ncbi:uncharacterized protein LOC133905027 [Phragmites australis]|uniref:uncharacterized protein LOC133905027 n=1 Tax=Phragmites australis TaxID=29695 RepID=UPI002D7848A0|nr:uncharacterized protein LOC133905027 [Phragmites australis]